MLDAAIADVETRLQARRERDGRASVEAERKAAVVERDVLADRIRAEWPLIIEHIASLFEAIEANDARLAACGSKEISAEAVARECAGNFYAGNGPIKRFTKMQIPELTGCNLAWPTTAPRFVLPTINADVSKETPKAFLLSSQHPNVVVHDVETVDGIVTIGHSPTPHRLDRDMVEAAKCKRLRFEAVAETKLAA